MIKFTDIFSGYKPPELMKNLFDGAIFIICLLAIIVVAAALMKKHK